MTEQGPPRRYHIVQLVGEGGFGRVYRARLEADRFVKDVAIKVLRDAQPDPAVMTRFRDEAHVLGLIRDRAVVAVDPPTQLDGRWAVVMEFVAGASCARLLREHGRFPPRAAVEVVMEVARALHKVWNHPGPDGRPLHLMHRDLKPANIQITPSGEVKVLDFGLAKADFDRESATTEGLVGTLGYVAPERFEGQESDRTDIYSLGVVLRKLLCGSGNPPESAGIPGVLDLISQMTSHEPGSRPSARGVESECAELLKSPLPGPSLRDWAETAVREPEPGSDPMVGSILTDSRTFSPPSRSPNAAIVAVAAAFGGTSAAVGLVALGAALVIVLVAGIWVGTRASPEPPEVAATPRPPVPAPAPHEEPVAAEVNDPPPEPAPAPEAAPVAPVAKAAPDTAPAPSPKPGAAVTREIVIRSIPLGADVTIDGRAVGDAPLTLALTEGTHRVELTSGEAHIVREVDVDDRAPRKYMWRVSGDRWEASY